MKRLLLVLLTLMIIILPCLASASQTGSAGSNALSDLEQLQLRLQDMTQIYSGGENVEVHRAQDQVVLPITLYQDTAEGRVELASYEPRRSVGMGLGYELPIIEITYRYMLFIDPYNGYTGGCFDAENSNDYQSTQQYMWIPKEHNVQVQFNALSDVRIETNGDKCTLSVTGGDIEITYVSELVYDQDGALIEKNETTVHAQHNFKAVHELPEGYIEK